MDAFRRQWRWFAMLVQPKHIEANIKTSHKSTIDKVILSNMRDGYKEMADINLSLSKLYFGVESEVETYYDRIAESD